MRWWLALMLGCGDAAPSGSEPFVTECEPLELDGYCLQYECCAINPASANVSHCWREVEGGDAHDCRGSADDIDCSDAAIGAQCDCKPECCVLFKTGVTFGYNVPPDCYDGEPTG